MSASPHLDPAPPIPSPRTAPAISPAATPSISAPPASPPSGDARLVTLLSDTIRERDDLGRELATTKRRLDRAERLLALSQSNSNPSGNGGPSSALLDYEARIENAEMARDESEHRRRVIAENWMQLERHLQFLEVHAADARTSFSRMLLEGGGPLVLASIPHLPITPLFTSQSPSHHTLGMPPPSHVSRHHIPSGRPSSLRSSVSVPHSSTPFSNMPLPPPPNTKFYVPGRIRPRANSTDGSVEVSGQPPTKKSKSNRNRDHDGERRGRGDRAMYTESVSCVAFPPCYSHICIFIVLVIVVHN